jgi:hypothetical protein
LVWHFRYFGGISVNHHVTIDRADLKHGIRSARKGIGNCEPRYVPRVRPCHGRSRLYSTV